MVVAAFIAAAQAGPVDYAGKPSYSAATDVAYSSVSVPASGPAPSYAKVSAPAYPKVATPVYAAPAYKVAAPYGKPIDSEEYGPAQYQFAYSVNDPHTGDNKSQEEHREGDVVKGRYTVVEADGSVRVVEYTADDHSGFNAVVHVEPAKGAAKSIVPVVAKVAAPVGYATPAVAAHGPVSYSAAPAVSYSSVASPQVVKAPAYYH